VLSLTCILATSHLPVVLQATVIRINAAIGLCYVLTYPLCSTVSSTLSPTPQRKHRQLYNTVNAQLFPRPQRLRHREPDMTHHIHHIYIYIYIQYFSHVANKTRVSKTEATHCTMTNICINLITLIRYKSTSEDNIKKISKAGCQNMHCVKMGSLK